MKKQLCILLIVINVTALFSQKSFADSQNLYSYMNEETGDILWEAPTDSIVFTPVLGNYGFNGTNDTISFNNNNRIGPDHFLPVNAGDIVIIKNGDGFQHARRFWINTVSEETRFNDYYNGKWIREDEQLVCPIDGYIGIMFGDAEDLEREVSCDNFDGKVEIIPYKSKEIISEDSANNCNGLAYSWWVTNHITDKAGIQYFGYISKDGYCGVASKAPDGKIQRSDLWKSTSCNDHNAPAVNIIIKNNKEYVIVIGATGQQGDNRINVYVASEPNTIRCKFSNHNHSIMLPDGYTATCTYAQVFVIGDTLYDFFNLHQINTSTWEDITVKACAKSEDYGETWSLYRVFYESAFDYLWLKDIKDNPTLKRILVQRNPLINEMKPICAGFIDLNNNHLYNNEMEDTGKIMSVVSQGELFYNDEVEIAQYNDFSEILPVKNGIRRRLLDVLESDPKHLSFLYGESISSDYESNFNLYRYCDGVITEIGNLGKPFYQPSFYLTGASFLYDKDLVCYSTNADLENNKNACALHITKLVDNSVASDKIIIRSDLSILRPVCISNSCIMYLLGRYSAGNRENAFENWALDVSFYDLKS